MFKPSLKILEYRPDVKHSHIIAAKYKCNICCIIHLTYCGLFRNVKARVYVHLTDITTMCTYSSNDCQPLPH